MDPRPETVDEVPYEETDMADVRAPPFSAGSPFFDHSGFGFGQQFGEGDERDWVDEEDEDEEDGAWGAQPECSHQ